MVSVCVSCGARLSGGACLNCGVVAGRYKKGGVKMAEQKWPKWKKGELVYCKPCDIVTTKEKAKSEDWISGAESYECPKCGGEVEVQEAVK